MHLYIPDAAAVFSLCPRAQQSLERVLAIRLLVTELICHKCNVDV